MLNKEHLSDSGILKIIALKADLNGGLTEDTKKIASSLVKDPLWIKNVENQVRPLHLVKSSEFKSIDPHWISGFAAGDGSFSIKIPPPPPRPALPAKHSSYFCFLTFAPPALLPLVLIFRIIFFTFAPPSPCFLCALRAKGAFFVFSPASCASPCFAGEAQRKHASSRQFLLILIKIIIKTRHEQRKLKKQKCYLCASPLCEAFFVF
jgi:hypothetical protein